ncbi:MAG: hypothetical protein KC432_08230 [Thermomicrobiales bacterium]|nr:hypothetical protein [Thermomicrobiales bacterium]
MVVQQDQRARKLSGSASEQELAGLMLNVMMARGMFMSANAVIRMPVAILAEYASSQGKTGGEQAILEAAAANPEVFAVDAAGDEPMIQTMRDGRAPIVVEPVSRHTFARRFLTPLPRPDRPVTQRPRPRLQEPVIDVMAEIVDLPLDMAPLASVFETERAESPAVIDLVEIEPEAPTPAVVEPPAARTITTQVTRATDVSNVDDLELARALRDRLGSDPRVATFGEQWLMEDRVPRFSRGDLRRLKDYLQEKEQPLTDDDLVQDVLGVRPGSAEFDLQRFALNYRLLNEHREFEFVGTANQRFWTTSGMPPIGTTRRKLTELGSDYRFLLEELGEEPAYRTRKALDHTLTFYEFIHGMLPYDREMQELLAGPAAPGQKSAVLTFECPQSFTTYLVELRFPTPNRGGFILGLDDFFAENLVPGAILSIQPTENDGHYRVEYLPEAARSEQLLELDERRALRYVFRPTTYACGVDEAQLLTEARFGGLANEKPLDEKVRRRPEAVIAATFERIGEEHGGNYSLDLQTLMAGVNIERPMSETLLRSVLENDDTGAFSRDPDADNLYTYVPGTTP